MQVFQFFHKFYNFLIQILDIYFRFTPKYLSFQDTNINVILPVILFFSSLKKYCKYFPCITVFHIHLNDDIKFHPSVGHILFDYSPIIGHLGNSQFFCALNVLIHIAFSFFVILFLGQVPRGGITRLKSMSGFIDLNFPKDSTNFQHHK